MVTDGEQTTLRFETYSIAGLTNLAPDGVITRFVGGHTRQLPRLTSGPFRFGAFNRDYLCAGQSLVSRPVKQAVISGSASNLLYPAGGIDGHSREKFLDELVEEAGADCRGTLSAGAVNVQVEFKEARLSVKLDPSKTLLKQVIDLNNRTFDLFTPAE